MANKSLNAISREGTTGKGVFYRLAKGASKGHKEHPEPLELVHSSTRMVPQRANPSFSATVGMHRNPPIIIRNRQANPANRQICNGPVVANPVEFDGISETVHNPDFNSGEFAIIKTQAGLNSYALIPKQSEGGVR